MKKTLASILAASALALGAQAGAQTLSIGFADPLSSLDPQLNNFAGDRSSDLHFFSMLLQKRGNTLTPDLAESWKVVDPTTWEFKLRPGVKWTDGQPLRPEDVIFSIERVGHVPGSVAPFSGFVRMIASVTQKGDDTIVVKTKTPSPNLPLNLASVHIVSKHVGQNAKSEDYNSGKALVGTGPYKLVSYTPGDRVVMTRNDGYWAGPQPWEKVIYRYISNPASRTAALLSGDVDVIDKVSVSDLARLEKSKDVSVYAYSGLRVMLLQPSFRKGPNPFLKDNNGKELPENPLLDVRVRKALSLAVNRQAIASRIMQNTVTVANQWMPADTFGYNPELKDIPFDPAKAKELLKEAGFPNGFQMTMHVPSDRYPLGPQTAQAVAQFWARIGVKTNVEVVPWAVYAAAARKNDYAMSMIAWGNGTGEASYALVNILATVSPEKGLGASNWGHYSSPKVDEDLRLASAEFDDQKREAILRDSATVVRDDVGIIPLYHYKNIWAARKGLKVVPWTSDRTVAMMVTKVQGK